MKTRPKTIAEVRDRLFVALDVDTAGDALELVRILSGCTRMFKVGPQLFTAAGPNLVRQIVASGARVFLDLKFHDIPNTVAAAAAAATRLGVSMFNVHAAGGREMMRGALGAANREAEISGKERPLVIGVTVLTSADSNALREVGVTRSVEDQVASLAMLSSESGLDGVVASPREVTRIRDLIPEPEFLLVTPGVRPNENSLNDQKRVMTPAQAMKAGANYLVVGRPITAAKDPADAARRVLDEMASVFD